jgi:hypothetical protein
MLCIGTEQEKRRIEQKDKKTTNNGTAIGVTVCQSEKGTTPNWTMWNVELKLKFHGKL